MKQVKRAIGGLLLASAALGAHAQSTVPAPRLTMDSGFYVGAGGGRVKGEFSCVATCDNKDTTWHGYVGYQINRHLAIEGGYSDFGSIESTGSIFGSTATARVDTTAVELAMLGIAPFTEKFSAYIKLGMYRYDSDAVLTGAVIGTSNAKGTEFTIGMGLQYSITDHIGARLEWQRYNDVSSGAPGLAKDDLTAWRLSGRIKF
jgi:OmpA-OmpF porin, OOP family